MIRLGEGLIRYRALLLWGLCLGLVLLSFFTYLPGGGWLTALILLVLAGFAGMGRGRPLPGRLRGFVVAAVLLSTLFGVCNFFFSLSVLRGSVPEEREDGYYLVNYDGLEAKSLTRAEYDSLKQVELRFWAGHMLIFSAIPMLHVEKGGGEKKE